MGQAELGPEDIDVTISPLKAATKRTWKAFCATTSIHGLKYTQDQDTSRAIRLIWLFITIIMFTCAIAMVTTFYLDYRQNPTRLNVDDDFVPIASLAFPCVTVCPEVSFNINRSREFIQTLRLPPNATPNAIVKDLYITHDGFIHDKISYEMEKIERLEQMLQLNNLTMLQFVRRLDWKGPDLFFRCRFQGRIMNCSELFQLSRTTFGHCWSFNCNQFGLTYFPKYATHYGLFGGASIMLDYADNELDTWPSYSRGFKLMVNSNNNFPSGELAMKFVALGEQAFLSVSPVETIASFGVHSLPQEQRHCVFPEEVQLTYSAQYTATNCGLSCRVGNMFKWCGCVTYFFNTRHRVCTYADIPCLTKHFGEIIGRNLKSQCHCPKSCESIDYEIQMTTTELQTDIPTVDHFYSGVKPNFSVAHIYFNSPVYRRLKQDLLSSMVTLVANLGSAFSLFIGMSMVSVVEIIYFFTIILRKYYLQEVRARRQLLFHKAKQALSDAQDNHIKFIKVH